MRLACGVESEELQALVDGELPLLRRLALVVHRRRCPACAAQTRRLLELRGRLRGYGALLAAEAHESAIRTAQREGRTGALRGRRKEAYRLVLARAILPAVWTAAAIIWAVQFLAPTRTERAAAAIRERRAEAAPMREGGEGMPPGAPQDRVPGANREAE